MVAESRELLLHHQTLFLQLCDNLGIDISWEKLDQKPSTHFQYLGLMINTSLKFVFPLQVRLVCFREVASLFPLLPFHPVRMWQPPVTDDPATPISLSQTCVEAVRSWLQEDWWMSGVPIQVAPLSCPLYTDLSLAGWGLPLLNLTASGVCSGEASQGRITVLYMRAVKLTLAAFLPQLTSQCIILLSNYVSVDAYLRSRGVTVSRRL